MVLDPTTAFRIYAHWRSARLDREDPIRSQSHQLARLLIRARRTQFGRDHGFAQLRSVDDFQKAVPLRRYDNFWREYWSNRYPVLENLTWPGLIPLFANSSGTSSGTTKHIPVSAAMMSANRRAALDILVHHLRNRPESHVLGGKSFFLGGSVALTPLAPGVAGGDLSGMSAARVPWWARRYYFPTGALAMIGDWEEKTCKLAARSLEEDIRNLSGTPSWLLLFIEELKRQKPASQGRLVEYYPNLELLVHGGVSFEPYRQRFAELLEGSHAETREVYPASEGFIAVADRGPGEGLRLITDNGLFMEFVPVDELESANPTRHWLATAEPGVNYAVVLSTCAGLWSYVIGDTVRFIETNPPRILITGRTSYGLSVFGEHLTGEELDQAVAEAAAAIGASLADYMVGPVMLKGCPGHHRYLVEFMGAPAQAEEPRFAEALDRALSVRNADYAEHRAGNYGMSAPEVTFLRPGTFAAWMRSRGKLGGQNKVPRVIADPDAFRKTAEAILSAR